MSELVGDRYRLDDPIGSGGMAEVWRASDARSGETVAIKRLHPGRAADPTARARFRREIEAARSVSHPAALRILDADPDAEVPWLAMEHVAGGTLADRLRGGRLDPATALDAAADVASVLASLDAQGLVHRDVTPSNILLPEGGGARLGDFGIARPWEASAAEDVTLTGDIVGTMRFVAPEVLAGHPATPAADVWALGAVLHEALSGKPTFDASSPAALLESQRTPPPAPLVAGPVVARLVDAMLDPEPSRRPSAASAASALRAAGSHAPDADRTTVIPAGTVAFGTAVSSRAIAADGAPAAQPPDPDAMAGSPAVRRRDAAPARTGRTLARTVLVSGLLFLAAVVLVGAVLSGRLASTGTDQATAAPLDTAQPRVATPAPSMTAVPTDPRVVDGRGNGGKGPGGGNGNGNGRGNGNGKGNGGDGG